MRRFFPVLLLTLIATASHAQSAVPGVPLETGADACKYAVIYNSKDFLDPDLAFGIHFDIGMCEDWARKQGNSEAAHNSFEALDSLYNLQSAALATGLREKLYPHDNAPPVCKVFMDYQAAAQNAIIAGITAKLPESEVDKNASLAQRQFLTGFSDSAERSGQAAKDSLTCSDWASENGFTVIALEVEHLADQLNADNPRQIPASIENSTPACRNAESEADAISDFVKRADDSRIMPHDVVPYFVRGTPLMHCAERLAQTKYGDANDHILMAVMQITNLLVIAQGNSEARLIRALPPPQSNRPIIVRVESPYQPASSPDHCTGTVFNAGPISNIDWNCGP